ncbi:hypothetical protein [Nocardioides sp.]|uniref:hypothetical protein n=1 Tax=Nocardioides sp. TaxID=35761 RepID=UPI0019C00A3C|nr:hypothetical protein [Nocardioides sp.]MBC7275913.1 hypothetical protein [Nocardioides sp.]
MTQRPTDLDVDSDPDVEPDHDPEGESSGSGGLWAWMQDSHPTVAALVGFYIGLAYAILVPGTWGALLTWVVGPERAEQLFAWVALTLLVPLALLIPRKTRRMAQFVWLGIILTVLVVVGVGGLVFWILLKTG